MPIRTFDAQVGLVVETTEGTKATLTAADFLPVANPKFTPNVQLNPLNKVTGSLSRSAGAPGLRSATISFDYYLRGASAAGTAPEIGAALKACGLKETIVATTSVTYTPADITTMEAQKSFTVAIERGGKAYRIWGARGTATISCKDGEPIMVSFTFTGADWEEVVAAKTAAVSYATLAEPVFFAASAMTLGGVAFVAASTGLDLGNTVTLRQSVSASSGHVSALITAREPKITLDPEEVADAVVVTAWRAGTTVALVAGPVGSAAGNRITLTAPALQYVGLSQNERGGMATLAIDALCCRSAGDDEFALAFT